MKYICLNPRLLENAGAMHDYLESVLPVPEGYGKNLDALYDVLTSSFEGTSVLLLRYEKDGVNQFPFSEGFFRVFQDAAEANRRLNVTVVNLPAI